MAADGDAGAFDIGKAGGDFARAFDAGVFLRALKAERPERAAWPDPADPPFLNAVALVDTDLGPEALLALLHEVETALGRVRTGRSNAPRAVDLDLIAHGREVRSAALVLPHPRAADRLFVMGPLAEIAPDWRHPVSGRSARALAHAAPVGRDAAPVAPRLQTGGDRLT